MANTPRDDRFPFLPAADRVIARTRRDPSSVPDVVGYESATSDDQLPLSGDDTSIFVRALGQASSDGTTGATPVQDGQPQILLLDQYGRPWVNVAPGSVQNVQGNIANDAPDLNSFPVKIGGRAVLTPSTGQVPAVAVDDRVNAAYDVNGRQIVVAGGDVAADSPDAGRPVKMGGVAGDPTTGLAAVTLGDRVNAARDVNGRDIVLAQGNVANDAPDAGFPMKIGGVALLEAPAPVGAGDRVQAYFDRFGRTEVDLEKQIAGENPSLNVLRTVRGKLPFKGESWLTTTLDNVPGQLVKTGPGRLGRVQIINTSATGLYILIHDATAFAVLGTIRWRGWVNALAGGVPGVLDIDFSDADGLYFEAGICVASSTAVAAIAGPTNIYGNTLYV